MLLFVVLVWFCLVCSACACARQPDSLRGPNEPKLSCPPGDWYQSGTHCYQLVPKPPKSVIEAAEFCAKLTPSGAQLPSFFEQADWGDITGVLLKKAASFNRNEIKFWMGLASKPTVEHQQWLWYDRVPMSWSNWVTPPWELLYEKADPKGEICGIGWAQKSTQRHGWLQSKCVSNPIYGDTVTICQIKPILSDKKSPHDNGGLTVNRVKKAFENVEMENGTKVVIDISKKDLEASNSLLDDLNRLVAQKMGLPAPPKRTFSPIRGDNYVTPEDLAAELDLIRASMGQKPLHKHKRSITSSIEKWTNRRAITYQYASNLGHGNPRYRQIFEKGIQFWQANTCFNFTIDKEADFVIIDGGGCYSVVGKAKFKRPQPISIGTGCDSMGVVTHEIGHMLGLDHQQTRPDRDDYVDIFLANVNLSNIDNFRTCCDCGSKTLKPYDYGSIMHYGPMEFSLNNGTTVLPKDPDYWRTIGNSPEPSFWDVKSVNDQNCATRCMRSKTKCKHGGYPHPRNCKTCLCPPGFGGSTCADYKDFDPEQQCGHAHAVTGEFHTFTSPNYPAVVKNVSCAWVFTAKENEAVELVFDKLFDMPEICKFGFIEVRAEKDLTPTGKRYCGGVAPNNTISEGNIMVVLLRKVSSIDQHHGFSAKVRSVRQKRKRESKKGKSKGAADTSDAGVNAKCVIVGGAVRNAGPAGLTLRADNE